MVAIAHRAAWAALLGLLLTVTAPLAIAGGHMTTYHLSPDHDDLGRSHEPDQAFTDVLGMPLDSCNVDANLDGQCEAYVSVPTNPATGVRVVAPGCTGDPGRSPSGTCWLALQTGGVAGEPGMSGNAAPGAFTTTKGAQVRFFDLNAYVFPLRGYIDQNKKLADLGITPVLAGLDPDLGRDSVLGPAGFSAWYGTWTDRNGNGVVDYMASSTGTPVPTNEFRWIGECGATIPAECQVQATRIPVWLYPGNHHAFATPDLPGLQAVCFASAVATVNLCGTLEQIDQSDDDFQGDPLLGPQGTAKPDSALDDRTDDPVNARHWAMGNGFPMWHYDQSIVVGEVVVAAVDPASSTLPGGFNPAVAKFRDVDVYRSWSPELESLLQGQVKPAVRGPWTSVVGGYVPINKFTDGVVNNAALDLTAATGPVDDAAIDPGRSREPNEAADQYPGATRGTCPGDPDGTHEGNCNNYAAHAQAFHAFADAQLIRSAFLVKPSVAGIGTPLIYGPQTIDGGMTGAPPRAAGDHSRTLGPGIYDPLGNIGVWRDRAHAMEEKVFDVAASLANVGTVGTVTIAYTVPPDGWVGNIVNNTGQFRYRGYAPEACTLYGAAGTYEHAQCDPYSSGAGDDPQVYAPGDGEWEGRCITTPTFTVRPDSVWTVPVFVWRDLETFEATDIRIEDYTGSSSTLTLGVECIGGTQTTTGTFVGRDMLVLPLGNLGVGVTTTLDTQLIPIANAPSERVVDVDRYRPG